MRVFPIVEGHGDAEALPILLRRLSFDVERPYRVKRNLIVKPGELERVVEFAHGKLGSADLILVLLDSDDDCPAELGPTLLARARAVTSISVSVVFAKREFEAWFAGAADSLRGQRGLSSEIATPLEPEALRNPKAWLSNFMPASRPYSETLDQPAFAATFDLVTARERAPSLDKLLRDLGR